MFEDSLMESAGRIKTKQVLTTTLSTVFQLMVVGFLVLLPLIFTEALPKGQLMTFLVAPPPPPPPPPPAPPTVAHVVHVSEIVNGELRQPSKIPKVAKMIKEDEAPQPSGVVGGVLGGVAGGSAGGVIGGIIGSTAPPPKVAAPQKIRVSQGVLDGSKIRDVMPVYPNMARVAHVQGDVVLKATINKQGVIEGLQAVSGPALLIPAAMDAVKQWRYKPYLLNQEPVEVDTVITVKFHL